RTHLGLTGIPATRLRGLVRFLEGFADGQDVDMAERPPDVPLPNFIRYGADDLKALYFEGHLVMKPAAGGEEIARWFWGETAARPAPAQVGAADRAAMARAASAFVGVLDSGQRRAAMFPFAQDERMNWHYVPRSRSGVAFKEMSAAGRAAAHELIKVSLSEVG